MSTTVRAELVKLRTSRSTIALLLAGLVYAVLNALATVEFAGRDGNAPLGSADNLANVLRGGNVATWVVLLVGLLSITGEYRHRTITSTYLATPRRGAVVRAKMMVIGVLGLVYASISMALGLAVVLARTAGTSTSIEIADDHTARVALGMLTATVLYGLVGVGVGGLVRNQTVATVGSLVWLVAVENVVGSVVSWRVARWFPGRAAEAAAGGGADILLPMAGGAALLAAYAVTATLVATTLALSRDVT